MLRRIKDFFAKLQPFEDAVYLRSGGYIIVRFKPSLSLTRPLIIVERKTNRIVLEMPYDYPLDRARHYVQNKEDELKRIFELRSANH